MQGAIVRFKDLVNIKDAISLKSESDEKVHFLLKKNRKLVIPIYQREIKWGEKQIEQLFNDIRLSSEHYIGSIVFKEKQDTKTIYEIIDGQQRLTALYIISIRLIAVLKQNGYQSSCIALEKDLCLDRDNFHFENESFPEIYKLISGEELEQEEKDIYKQKTTIYKLIKKVDELIQEYKKAAKINELDEILKKLTNVQANIVLIEQGEVSSPEEIFVNINDKGKKLDSEDILKGYVFKKLRGDQDIYNSWVKIKKKMFQSEDYKIAKGINDVKFIFLISVMEYSGNFKKDFSSQLNLKTNTLSIESTTSKVQKHFIDLLEKPDLIKETVEKSIRSLDFVLNVFKDDENTLDILSGMKNAKRKPIYQKQMKTILKSDKSTSKYVLIKLYLLMKNDSIRQKNHDLILGVSVFHVVFSIYGNDRKGIKDIQDIIESKTISEFRNNLHNKIQAIIKADKRINMKFEALKRNETDSYYLQELLQNVIDYVEVDGKKFKYKDDDLKLNLTRDHIIAQNKMDSNDNEELANQINSVKKSIVNYIYHKDKLEDDGFLSRIDELFKAKNAYCKNIIKPTYTELIIESQILEQGQTIDDIIANPDKYKNSGKSKEGVVLSPEYDKNLSVIAYLSKEIDNGEGKVLDFYHELLHKEMKRVMNI